MDPNLTYPIILNPTLNATLNATLFQTQEGIYESIKEWVQILLSLTLTILTFYLWRSTSGYASQVEIQTKIMKTNMEKEIDVLKYHRLHDEMNNLVAPLYSAALSTNIEEGKLGLFTLIKPAEKYYPQFKHVSEFWDEIKRNIYLSGDETFSKDIIECFSKYDEYWRNNQSADSRRKYIAHLEAFIPKIKEERYPALKHQIQEIESKISVNSASSTIAK